MEYVLPIYEYECVECKHRFERYQSFSEPPVAACPDCGSAVRKVLQAVGIVFKGSGWYKNDSRGTRPSEKADAPKDAPADGKASGDAKSDVPAKSESAGTSASSKSESGKQSDSGIRSESGSKPAAAAAGSKQT